MRPREARRKGCQALIFQNKKSELEGQPRVRSTGYFCRGPRVHSQPTTFHNLVQGMQRPLMASQGTVCIWFTDDHAGVQACRHTHRCVHTHSQIKIQWAGEMVVKSTCCSSRGLRVRFLVPLSGDSQPPEIPWGIQHCLLAS